MAETTTDDRPVCVKDEEIEHGTPTDYVDPWCDLCYDETGDMVQAHGFCPECNAFLCKTCQGNHRKWPLLQNHKFLLASKMPRSQAEKPVKYPDCTKHAENIMDHYCVDHSEMLCNECMKLTHKMCTATPMSLICMDLGSADIQQFETIVDTLKQNVLSTKSALESNVTDIENQKDDLIRHVKAERDKIISTAEKLYENTVAILSEACEQKNAYIIEQLMTLDNIIHSLDETSADIKKKINIKFDQNVFIRMQQIVEKAKGYKADIENLNKEIRTITLSFSPSSEIFTVLSVSKYLGEVKEISSRLDGLSLPEMVFPQTSALTGKARLSKRRGDISQIRVNKMSSLDIRLMQDKQTCSAIGIAVTNKGIVLLSDEKNKSVKALSKDKLLSCLSFSERTLGISVFNDQKATVCTVDKKLHILNISDPVNISIDRSVFLGYLVVGMAQYNGNLIVTTFDEPQCVKMIDLNGEEKWSVSVDHKGQQLFDTLHSVTISTSNDISAITVSDWGKDTLTVFNSNDRHVIKTVGVRRKGPHGLTSDKDGNIYVCYGRPKEICVFSPDFMKSRILLSSSDLCGGPTDIVYCSKSNTLYIAYYENDIVDCFRLA